MQNAHTQEYTVYIIIHCKKNGWDHPQKIFDNENFPIYGIPVHHALTTP